MNLNFLEIFLLNPIGQTIGFFALFLTIIAFISKKDNHFLIFMILASFFWGIHFLSLGLYSASFVNFFDTFKNYLALKYKSNKYFFIFLFISYIFIGIFTIDLNNYISFIPIINSLLSVFIIFYLKGIRIKLGFLFILILWFIYNYFGNSISGMLSDIILFIAGIIGIIRINKILKTKAIP